MKSYRTSISGFIALVGVAVAHFWPQHADLVAKMVAVGIAYGLLNARDNKVSSEDVQGKPTTNNERN
jgi:hypothetical protein